MSNSCVMEHWHTPCRFGVSVNHLQSRPTNPPTQRYSLIPSGTVVSRYHNEGGRGKPIILVVAQVEGIGPVLHIVEEGCRACHFVFELHRLLWWHRMLVLGLAGWHLDLLSLSTRRPQLSNAHVDPMLLIGCSTTGSQMTTQPPWSCSQN